MSREAKYILGVCLFFAIVVTLARVQRSTKTEFPYRKENVPFTELCIDKVTYIVTPNYGMSVKFNHKSKVVTCDN